MTEEIAPDQSKAQAPSDLMTKYLERAVERDFKPYLNLIAEGFSRCMKLVVEAEKAEREISGDILRAVVVLNHAYLEDYLRTLAFAFLPAADERTLDDVPLAGIGCGQRAEKFYLGKLARHRGKTVDQVIGESVSEHMERSTFNDVTQIISFLKSLALKLPENKDETTSPLELPVAKETWVLLDAMIRRRHQIVHRADKGKTGLQPIDPAEVTGWLIVSLNFTLSATTMGFMKLHSFEEFKKKVEALKARVIISSLQTRKAQTNQAR